MYDTILVPLDGSKRAEAIVPHVEQLARRFEAKVVFFQAVEPFPLVVGAEEAYGVLHHGVLKQHELEEKIKQAESYLASLREEFRKKGIEARARVAHGPAVEGIINAGKREGADLIAIASHGRSGLPRVFYGSVAAGVLHRVDRPLLVVRSGGKE